MLAASVIPGVLFMAEKENKSFERRLSSAGLFSRTIMQVAISLSLLGASLIVILSGQYDPSIKHWAFATVGTLLGFWLKR
jgi:hypothetical protein